MGKSLTFLAAISHMLKVYTHIGSLRVCIGKAYDEVWSQSAQGILEVHYDVNIL